MENYTEYPMQRLVGSDQFYPQVQERLEDPNETDYKGFTLLHVAALSHAANSRVLKLLLDKGADVKSTTPQGHKPLHFAVSSRKRDTIVALLEAGASVNSKDLSGRTTLHFAITKRWPNPSSPVVNIACDMWIVKRLLCDPEIIIDPVDDEGETPLMWAVKERNSVAVEELLKRGANPNIPDINKRTPLHKALSTRYPSNDVICLLLTNGADIYCEDNLGQTPVNILVENIYDDQTLLVAVRWVRLIVSRYPITESFQCLMREYAVLFENFERFYEEIKLMKSMVVYDDVTIHDFALGCFRSPVEDPVTKICTPVVEFLLTGCFVGYFELILHRIPMQDLRSMMGRISNNPIPPNTSHLTIFNAIVHLYGRNPELKRRLNRIKDLFSIYSKNCN